MIPSVNSPPSPDVPYPSADNGWKFPDDLKKLSYYCDCCMKHVEPVDSTSYFPSAAGGMRAETKPAWGAKMNPRLVRVYDVTYWACSTECARILFNIHHQYAMKLHL